MVVSKKLLFCSRGVFFFLTTTTATTTTTKRFNYSTLRLTTPHQSRLGLVGQVASFFPSIFFLYFFFPPPIGVSINSTLFLDRRVTPDPSAVVWAQRSPPPPPLGRRCPFRCPDQARDKGGGDWRFQFDGGIFGPRSKVQGGPWGCVGPPFDVHRKRKDW